MGEIEWHDEGIGDHFDNINIGPLIGVSSMESIGKVYNELLSQGTIPFRFVDNPEEEIFKEYTARAKTLNEDFTAIGVFLTIEYTEPFD